MSFPPHVPLLHVYPSGFQHDQTTVVGNRAGLEALKRVVDRAVECAHATAEGAMAADGECFAVVVVPVDEAAFDETPVPYDDLDIRPIPPWLRAAPSPQDAARGK